MTLVQATPNWTSISYSSYTSQKKYFLSAQGKIDPSLLSTLPPFYRSKSFPILLCEVPLSDSMLNNYPNLLVLTALYLTSKTKGELWKQWKATHHVQAIINRINNQFLIKNQEAKDSGIRDSKRWKKFKNPVNQASYGLPQWLHGGHLPMQEL